MSFVTVLGQSIEFGIPDSLGVEDESEVSLVFVGNSINQRVGLCYPVFPTPFL
jgi:hypothetical protein